MNVLFVCRGNLQRSPTAEELLRKRANKKIKVKSAGINKTAKTRVNKKLLDWADQIYVMMEGIKKRMREEFPKITKETNLKVLGIPDRYRKGEPRLKIRLLKEFSKDKLLSKFVNEEEINKKKKDLFSALL